MKRILLLLIILFTANIILFAQNRSITRGATPGELYLTGTWYCTYNSLGIYDTIRNAIYHITENGKKLNIQYDFDRFAELYTPPGIIMQPQTIIADATPGVIYSICTYYKDNYVHTQLWISFDYGKSWISREENIGSNAYYAANVEGLIYKVFYSPFYESSDYGNTFSEIDYTPGGSEPGLQNGEGFSLWSRLFRYSCDFGKNFIEIPIDSQFVFGTIMGRAPDVYRGGLPGEVYVDSWFPDDRYRVSFSADTGQTFRHVYFCDDYDPYTNIFMPIFMSDREPGVYYIINRYEEEDTNPCGWHVKVCIYYYREYGELLEAVFCHDLTKKYEFEEIICDNATYLEATVNLNSVQLQWINTADNIRGYHVFRNGTRISNELLTEPSYLDPNLLNENYEYFVRTYYEEGCVSDSSNHVMVKIGVGIKEFVELDNIAIFPNPTTGKLEVESSNLLIMNIDIFDIYGKELSSHHLLASSSHQKIDIPHLQAGIYFVRITTEKGIVTTKKIIKY